MTTMFLERQECQPDLRGGVAIICSSHVNAIGIALSLREIGWEGRVICVNINEGSSLARRWPALCDCWDVTVSDPAGIFDCVADRIPLETVSAVFFTDKHFFKHLPTRARARMPSCTFGSARTDILRRCWTVRGSTSSSPRARARQCPRDDLQLGRPRRRLRRRIPHPRTALVVGHEKTASWLLDQRSEGTRGMVVLL